MAKVGRPKKTLDDLPKDWEKRILDLKSEGGSDVECRAALDISKDLWYRFIDDIPKFSETIKKGDELCETWWLKVGREGVFQTSGGGGVHTNLNPTLWYMNMKNRFGWRDKQEVELSVKENAVINIVKDPDNN